MKANRSRFDKVRIQWDILKLTSAITKYEQNIVREEYDFETMEDIMKSGMFKASAEEYTVEEFQESHKAVSSGSKEKDKLIYQMKALEDLGQELLAEEKYLEVQECKEIWDKLNEELKKL